MTIRDLEPLNLELELITDEYIRFDGNCITLDGHFTVEELKAIVAKIDDAE